MILILTSNSDLSSDLVCEYLLRNHTPYLRINTSQLFENEMLVSSTNGSVNVYIEGKRLPLEDISVIWFRKFLFFSDLNMFHGANNVLDIESIEQIKGEFMKIVFAFISLFKNKIWIPDPYRVTLNKFQVLLKAEEVGFNIPNTYLTNNRKLLKKLVSAQSIISKSIKDPLYIEKDGFSFLHVTHRIKMEFVEKLPPSFFTSYFQEEVDKEYEIRIFNFLKKNFAMKVRDPIDRISTISDYRIGLSGGINITEPYELPCEVSKMVNDLMDELSLNTGSIDLIKNKNGEYVFLEVNPLGQFGMVDFPCNYGIHEFIAKELAKLSKKQK